MMNPVHARNEHHSLGLRQPAWKSSRTGRPLPFGGARAPGTNDKAGSFLNRIRWTSPRTLKECFAPHRHFQYPYLGGA
jgi:hypothetical protein